MTKWSNLFVKQIPTRAFNPPVGTVVYSILSLGQFQAEMGDLSWVLMDGADITGTTLASLTGNNLLPDAAGRFLRVAGGAAAAVGAQQAQSTAVNGLGNAASSVTGSTDIDHDHASATTSNPSANHTHTATHNHPAMNTATISANHDHTITNTQILYRVGGSYVQTGGTGWDFNTTQPVTAGISANHTHYLDIPNLGVTSGTVSSWHTHTLNIPNYNTSNRALASGSAAAQTITGDTETRPDNVTVNAFIKIK